MSPRKKKREPRLRHVARKMLVELNALPEHQARRAVHFLALVYLRPANCRSILRVLTMDAPAQRQKPA